MLAKRLEAFAHKLIEGLSWKNCLGILLGAAICTFGIHNIHQRTPMERVIRNEIAFGIHLVHLHLYPQ